MVITEEDFDRALDILEKTEKKMPYAFSGYGKNPASGIMETITRFIRKRGVVAYDELLRLYRNDVDKRGLDQILDTLLGFNAIKVEYAGNRQKLIHFILEGDEYETYD